MDILTYIDRVKANYSKQPEPVYNTKKYFTGGRVGFNGGKLVEQNAYIPPTEADKKFALEKYKKPFEELDRNQRGYVRKKKFVATRTPKSSIAKEIETFVKKFTKENKNPPSVNDIRKNVVNNAETVKEIIEEKNLKVLNTSEALSTARSNKVNEEIKLLLKNEKIKPYLKNAELPPLSLVKKVAKLTDDTIASFRTFDLFEAYSGERKIPGIKPVKGELLKEIKILTKQMDKGGFGKNPAANKIRKKYETEIMSNFPEYDRRLGSYRKDIGKEVKKFGAKNLSYQVDEVASVISSGRGGTSPYGIYGQGLSSPVNLYKGFRLDNQKSLTEKSIKKLNTNSKDYKKNLNELKNNYNNKVDEFLKDVNKKKKGLPVRAFKMTTDINQIPQDEVFLNNFRTKNYGFIVPKDINRIPETLEQLKNDPKKIKQVKLAIANGDNRIYSFVGGLPDTKSLNFGKFGKALKIAAKGEAAFGPLIAYAEAGTGSPWSRTLNTLTYNGLGGLFKIGESERDFLKKTTPGAETVFDIKAAQEKYDNTDLNLKKTMKRYQEGSTERGSQISPTELNSLIRRKQQLGKDLSEKVTNFYALSEKEQKNSFNLYNKGTQTVKDIYQKNKERRFYPQGEILGMRTVPRKELATDIADYIGEAFKSDLKPTENIYGTALPMGNITGKIQTDFATGGIASLTKTVAPKKGPESEGLAYFMKRGKK